MNDIEKRIGIILTDPELHYAGGLPDTKGMISKITTLYHQLLSEEKVKLVELQEAAQDIVQYLEPSMVHDLMYRPPSVALREAADSFDRKEVAIARLKAILATLNKEKD